MSTKEIEDEVKEELFHIQENTNKDGTVDVEIEDWVKKSNSLGDEKVRIEFIKPSREIKTETMDWPQRATEEYKFYRIVKSCGYDLYNADQIKGCKIKYDDEIVAPKSKSRIQKLRESIENPSDASTMEQILFLSIWPLVSAMLFIMYLDMGNDIEEVARGMILATIGWTVWSIIPLFLTLIFFV